MPRPTLVVDASVAVKWILPEDGHEEAVLLQDQYQEEKIDLIAPTLLIAEVANVLWKRARRGDLTFHDAQHCFQGFLRDSPILMESSAMEASALGLALAHGRPAYDCLYLALALEHRCDLITADERFFRAMNPALPCIRLLSVPDSRPGSAGR
jgi:predicted nucleic acid-binding protein